LGTENLKPEHWSNRVSPFFPVRKSSEETPVYSIGRKECTGEAKNEEAMD
jgi:hypothetical protein